jgi:hypothetical protein
MFSVAAATFGVRQSATGRIRGGELDAAFPCHGECNCRLKNKNTRDIAYRIRVKTKLLGNSAGFRL